MGITKGTNVKADISVATSNANLGGVDLWRKTGLECPTIMESFVVNYKGNKDLYIAQCTTGATNPDRGSTQGDIDLNRVDKNAVKQSVIRFRKPDESTYWNGSTTKQYNDFFENYNRIKNGIRGWGHPSQMAIEYAPDGAYIWVPHDCPMVARVLNQSDNMPDVYYQQTRLARVKLDDAQTYYTDESTQATRVKTFTLTSRIAGLTSPSNAIVSIDNVNRVLGVLYKDQDDVWKVTTFSMAYNSNYATSLKMGDIIFTELETTIVTPVRYPRVTQLGWSKMRYKDLSPGGFAIFGDYIYIFYGSAYWDKTENAGQNTFYAPTPAMITSGSYMFDEDGNFVKSTKAGNATLQCINRYTKAVETSFTEAGKSISFRETAGLFIIPTLDGSGNVTSLELLLGFAGGTVGNRDWTIMSKKTTI